MTQRCHIVVAIAVMLVAAMVCVQAVGASAETAKENGAENGPASGKLTLRYLHPEKYPEIMPELSYVRVLYDVSSATGECPPGARLTLSFAGENVTGLGIENLAIFHYDPGNDTWSDLPSMVDKKKQTVTATISKLGIYTISSIATGDREPPTVRWLLPRKGETLTGETKLIVIPKDNVGVTLLQFYLDDRAIAVDRSNMDGVWGATVDFSHYVSGTHTLKVVAHDRYSNVGEATRQVVLQTAAAAPEVTIGTPQYVDPRTVEVSGTMSDPDGEVWGLALEMDGQPAGGEIQIDGNQWSTTLTHCEFGPGEHTFVSRGFDNYGNEGTATISASLPLGSACLSTDPYSAQLENTEITLTAGATGGTDNVEYKFMVNGDTLQDYGPDNTCVWTPDTPDTYTLTVLVQDPGQGGPVSYQQQYTIASPLSGVDLTVEPFEDTEMSLTATPTGGANLEYRFEILDGPETGVLQDYYWANGCLWKPTQPGTYTLEVSVREMGTTEEGAFDIKVYFVE